MTTRATALAAAALAALVPAGCGGAARVGASPGHARVITMLNPVDDAGELQPFADAVDYLSHGRLRVRVVKAGTSAFTDYEARVVRAVQHGRATLAWAGSRAWDGFGVHSMQALEAPLLIDSYALEERVLGSGLVPQMLAPLRRLGLVGLGILPGPLRKPLGARAPLLAPAAFRGLRVGVQQSRVASQTVRALSAQPVAEPVNGNLRGVDAIDRQVGGIGNFGIDRPGPHLAANVDLWPRPIVIYANARSFAALPAADQRVLRAAAAAAARPTLAVIRDRETELAGDLCRGGNLTFDTASPAQLRALRRAVQPVYAELERDAQTRAAIATISALKRDLVQAPEGLPHCTSSRPAPPAQPQRTALDGTWVMDTVRNDAPPDFLDENWGHWIFVFGHGRFADTQENRTSCTWGYGTYSVDGHRTHWAFLDGGGKAPNQAYNKLGEAFAFDTSTYRDILTLAPVKGAISPINFRAKPWRRVSHTADAARMSPRCLPPPAGLPR